MKLHKNALPIAAIIILSLSLFACGGNVGKNSFSIESAHINEEGEQLRIDAEYPVLKGLPSADEINSTIKGNIDDAAKDVREAAADLKGRPDFTASLGVSYQYFFNEDIISLCLNYDNYLGGAHGLYWMDCYTINVGSGQIYEFEDLFLEEEGVEYITERILREVEADKDLYFDTAQDTILDYEGDYKFLINGNILQIYFPLYDIAPYAAGIRSFSFTEEELQGFLRPEILVAMAGQESSKLTMMEF